MEENHHQIEEPVSQYPDPEQSGLTFPWLDQYQPVAAEQLSARLQPIVHEGYVPRENGSSSASTYHLRGHPRPTMLAMEDDLHSNAVLEDSEEDPEFVETDAGEE